MIKGLKIIVETLIGLSCVATNLNKDNQNFTLVETPKIYYDTFDIDENPIFASMEDRNIYIAKDRENIDCNENDIIILDFREEAENIVILNSHRITSQNTQKCIISLILTYNEKYPSETPWIRTEESLLNEWIAHNLAYSLNYQRSHTIDVDFENKEEFTYRKK